VGCRLTTPTCALLAHIGPVIPRPGYGSTWPAILPIMAEQVETLYTPELGKPGQTGSLGTVGKLRRRELGRHELGSPKLVTLGGVTTEIA